MGRILFFVLLAIAVYVLWKSLRRQSSAGDSAVRRTDASPAQAMVSCAHCGLHVPRSDALPAGDRFYCCEEHRQRGTG